VIFHSKILEESKLNGYILLLTAIFSIAMLPSTLSLQPIQAQPFEKQPFVNPNETLQAGPELVKAWLMFCSTQGNLYPLLCSPPPPPTKVVSPGDTVITEKPPKHCVEVPDDCYSISPRYPPQPHCPFCPIIDLSSLKDNESIIITPPPGGQVVLSKILNENISGRLQSNYTNSTLLMSKTQ
jgi:hypothetical protein